jgi:hypothetical protein
LRSCNVPRNLRETPILTALVLVAGLFDGYRVSLALPGSNQSGAGFRSSHVRDRGILVLTQRASNLIKAAAALGTEPTEGLLLNPVGEDAHHQLLANSLWHGFVEEFFPKMGQGCFAHSRQCFQAVGDIHRAPYPLYMAISIDALVRRAVKRVLSPILARFASVFVDQLWRLELGVCKPTPNMARKRPTKHENSAGASRWDDRFIAILKRDYSNLDRVIAAILKNEPLARMCAVKISTYVDKDVSDWLYKTRKVRGAKHKKSLEIAIAGINEAISLYRDRGRQKEALYLSCLAVELSGELGRSREAYSTKRHGRDRSHLILYDCKVFLESVLGHRITYSTLANLVNAGFEADGNPPKDPVTEEQLRKNLEAFQKRNPMAVVLAARNYPRTIVEAK